MSKTEPLGNASGALSMIVVDTDQRVGQAFARLLEAVDLGPSIVSFPDARSAVAAIESRGADLAVVTLGLSELDAGLGAIALLLTELELPVIALSSREGLRRDALEYGASAFIHYGSDPAEVLELVRDALVPSIGATQTTELT